MYVFRNTVQNYIKIDRSNNDTTPYFGHTTGTVRILITDKRLNRNHKFRQIFIPGPGSGTNLHDFLPLEPTLV